MKIMETTIKLRLKSTLLLFLLGVFITVSVAPTQAQVTKRNKQTKKKTNFFIIINI